MRVSIFGILLFIVVALVGFTVTIVVVLLMRRRRRVGHPSCGKCGYRVAGLETLRCPECGSDLREVGIDTIYGGRRPG